MNKIIPFNKDIIFDDGIGKINSIALKDDLKFLDSYNIKGELIVKGNHTIGDIEEDFSYSLPTSIKVDEKYDTSKATITVDDFYYEIINDNTMKVKIDLLLDNLSFKEQTIETITPEVIEDKVVDTVEEYNPLEKEYSIYRVYVVLEGDNLSKILEKYNITSEELSHYNNLENIKPGMKLIIPSTDE